MEVSEKVKVLQDLIKIHSVNGNEVEVAHYLQKLLASHGIDSKVDEFGDRRANLIAEIGTGESKKILGLTGHQDTVAVPNLDRWQHDPFGGEISGDYIFGRGAADMKSGLAAQAIVLIELKEAGQLPSGTVRFIATAGEELGTPGAYRLQKQGIADDLDALVVGEPTGGNVIFAHSGSMNYRVTSYGKSCHSSHPQNGINAIEGLLKFIEEEKHLFDNTKDDQYLGKVQHSITVIDGGSQVNTIPDSASLHGNYAPNVMENKCDVLIAIGMRFSDRVTGRLDTYAKQAKIIHLDIDEAEIDKNVKTDVAVVGDCKMSLPAITRLLKKNVHRRCQNFQDRSSRRDATHCRSRCYIP